jgi:hypothetical protein
MLNSLRFWTISLFLFTTSSLLAKSTFEAKSSLDSTIVVHQETISKSSTKIFIKEGTTVSNLSALSHQVEIVIISSQKKHSVSTLSKTKSTSKIHPTQNKPKVETKIEEKKITRISQLILRKCPSTDSFSAGTYHQNGAVPTSLPTFFAGNLISSQWIIKDVLTTPKLPFFYLNQSVDSYLHFTTSIRPPPVSLA